MHDELEVGQGSECALISTAGYGSRNDGRLLKRDARRFIVSLEEVVPGGGKSCAINVALSTSQEAVRRGRCQSIPRVVTVGPFTRQKPVTQSIVALQQFSHPPSSTTEHLRYS